MKQVSALYRLLGDEARLRLLRVLSSERLNVTELTGVLGLAQSGVSRHLGLLKEAGLVADRAEGTRRVYYIDPDGLGELRRWFDQFWDDALLSFKNEVARSNLSRTRKKT